MPRRKRQPGWRSDVALHEDDRDEGPIVTAIARSSRLGSTKRYSDIPVQLEPAVHVPGPVSQISGVRDRLGALKSRRVRETRIAGRGCWPGAG
jgi:hypothetical protein